ncbi:MAG: histidine-type phosphatase [Caulobacterales bacterium]
MARFAWGLGAFCALVALACAGGAAAATLKLERVVLVTRHGVRPPTETNDALAKYAAKSWPAWPVAAGELTDHGAATVKLVGETLRRAYRADGVLPRTGCPSAGAVQIWADGTDQRTRRTGEVLAEALAPGCGVKAGWAPPDPRDPIFGGKLTGACALDPNQARAAVFAAAGPGGLQDETSRRALRRLQTILAPTACSGGKGYCFKGEDTAEAGARLKLTGPLATSSSLAEDLLLEYAEGMPASQVGWGRAGSQSVIAEVMAAHERFTRLTRQNVYFAGRYGAPMARLILAALDGAAATSDQGPALGPNSKLVDLAGHDTNLSATAGVFGLDWTLPEEPDATAPATTLAFELWVDPASGARFVRPVLFYESLKQLRTLAPANARRLVLKFQDCASGPNGTCAMADLRRRAEAAMPTDCGPM